MPLEASVANVTARLSRLVTCESAPSATFNRPTPSVALVADWVSAAELAARPLTSERPAASSAPELMREPDDNCLQDAAGCCWCCSGCCRVDGGQIVQDAREPCGSLLIGCNSACHFHRLHVAAFSLFLGGRGRHRIHPFHRSGPGNFSHFCFWPFCSFCSVPMHSVSNLLSKCIELRHKMLQNCTVECACKRTAGCPRRHGIGARGGAKKIGGKRVAPCRHREEPAPLAKPYSPRICSLRETSLVKAAPSGRSPPILWNELTGSNRLQAALNRPGRPHRAFLADRREAAGAAAS